MEHDRIMSNKFIYHFTEPKPGDVVVFTPSQNIHTDAPRLVKRLIGVEGDRIEIKNGRVFRNGTPLFEPYVNQTPDYTLPPVRVPEGFVFVLGDNRRNSYDSHAWGFLPRRNIIAKAMFCYWPVNRIGMLQWRGKGGTAMAQQVKIWYDPEGDFLEVLFPGKAGYMKETNNNAVMERVDDQGDVLGFTVMGVSRLAKEKTLVADLIPA
jgi:signal peptidase I